MRCSHLSIYGNIVKISRSVSFIHMKFIIGEWDWEFIFRDSVDHIDLPKAFPLAYIIILALSTGRLPTPVL